MSSKVSRLHKFFRLWKCRVDCKELQGDQTELTEAVIRYNTFEAQKVFTWEKIYILPIVQTILNNFPTASGRKNVNARKMKDGIL